MNFPVREKTAVRRRKKFRRVTPAPNRYWRLSPLQRLPASGKSSCSRVDFAPLLRDPPPAHCLQPFLHAAPYLLVVSNSPLLPPLEHVCAPAGLKAVLEALAACARPALELLQAQNHLGAQMATLVRFAALKGLVFEHSSTLENLERDCPDLSSEGRRGQVSVSSEVEAVSSSRLRMP